MASKTVDEVRKALECIQNAGPFACAIEHALVTEGLKILDDYAEVKAEYEKALNDSDLGGGGYREYILAGMRAGETQINLIAAILRSAGRIPLTLLGADEETIKAERASADKYEAESEQKGADLMAAESVIAEQAEDIEALRTAFGLLSTLAPKVVMAPASPAEVVATAKEIHQSVSKEIEKLKAERVEK